MLTLKELRFKGIGRFVDEQIVKFDDLGNLVQVDGQNNNTGGSSGSGKTTIFNALDYLFGLNDVPVTVLQSRFTKEGILVTGLMDWDGKDVELTRGKGKLAISIDGNIVEGSAKLVEEKIDEILGMSRDLFRPIMHKRQKEGGFFLNMTPSKTHEFLTNALGLTEYKKKLDFVDLKIKELAQQKANVETNLATARAGLSATQNAVLALGLAPVRDMHQAVVLDLKSKYEQSNIILNEIVENHKIDSTTLEAQRPTPLPRPELKDAPFDRSVWDQAALEVKNAEQTISKILQDEKDRQTKVKQAISERRLEATTLNHQVSMAQTYKTEAATVAGEIKKIRDCLCPTCEQSWVTDAASKKESELLAKIMDYKQKIEHAAAAQDRLVMLNMQLEILEKELAPKHNVDLPFLNEKIAAQTEIIIAEKAKFNAHQSSQSFDNSQALDAWTKKQNELNAAFTQKEYEYRGAYQIKLDQARGQMDVDRRAFDAAVAKLRAYEEASFRYETSLKTLKAQESTYLARIDELTYLLNSTEKYLLIAENAKAAVKSFMSCSFDDALEEIGDVATRIIRAIPNMANSTIQFQGLRETQAGKVKEEVNAVVSMDGEEGIDLRSLSGGERSSADLAIDLAVIELIENRSNKGISVFILDEPFTGLDTVSVEMVLEVLKGSKINKKLFIVDHNESVKEMVSDCVLVVRDGTTSMVKQ